MDIKEIIDLKNASPDEVITQLKEKSIDVIPWSRLKKEYDPMQHPVMDKKLYPDIVEKDGMLQKVTRVTYDLQRLAAKRLTELCFGVPVKRVYKIEEGDAEAQEIADALEAIYKNNRIDSVNITRGGYLFASCEVMTLWYAQLEDNKYYGFDSHLKLRSVSFSPMRGDELYPLFDEYGDLIALSVKYTRKEGTNEVTYFDAYTADRHIKWKNAGEWEVIEDDNIIIGKIPAIYMYRETPAWEQTSELVYEMEWAMSRNGNYLRENSRPLFVVYADEEIQFGNEPSANSSGKSILKYPVGSNAGYVTWQQAVDSLRFHVTELRQIFFTQLQLPDWSFDNMKSVPMSGESMKQMFIDAILKVKDESGRLIEFLDREMNVVKAFLKQMRPEWSEKIDALSVEMVITPCTVDESSTDVADRSGEMRDGVQQQTDTTAQNRPTNV